MKIALLLAVSVLSIFFAQDAGAQSVLFRHASAKFESYRNLLRESSFRTTPMEELEKRLRTEELSDRQQRDLDETLARVAADPTQAAAGFSDLYSRFQQDPRSMAMRETLRSLLERLIEVTNAQNRLQLKEELENLSIKPGTDGLSFKISVSQKEVSAKLRRLRSLPGGEDAVLFWNGFRWNEQLPIKTGVRGQWILLSSQWKARLMNGTWSEVSGQIDEGFRDWVSGTCAEPVYQDVAFVSESRREAVFEDDCLPAKEQHYGTPASPLETRSNRAATDWKPLIWTGAATVAVLALLSVSGKKLQIRR